MFTYLLNTDIKGRVSRVVSQLMSSGDATTTEFYPKSMLKMTI